MALARLWLQFRKELVLAQNDGKIKVNFKFKMDGKNSVNAQILSWV